MIKYYVIKKSKNITICPSDKIAVMEELKAGGANVKDTYQESLKAYKNPSGHPYSPHW